MSSFKFHYFDIIDSTQKYAIRNNTLAMNAIIAGEQTQGVGKPGSTWHSPYGNLYSTYVIPDNNMPNHQIIQSATVALIQTLHMFDCKDSKIKWLNDIVLNGKKIAGVICDRTKDRLLIGMGLNLKVGSAECTSASIFDETGLEIDPKTIAEAYGNNLLQYLDLDYLTIRTLFQANLLNLNNPVLFEHNGIQTQGIIRGISEAGELILMVDDQEIRTINTKIVLTLAARYV